MWVAYFAGCVSLISIFTFLESAFHEDFKILSFVVIEETKKPGVDMAKVTKLYLQKVEKKIVALTNEESELEEALEEEWPIALILTDA